MILAIFLTGCASCSPNQEPYPDSGDDNVKYCADGCDNLKSLDCPEGQDIISTIECIADENACNDFGSCINGYCTETCAEFCTDEISSGKHLGAHCWTTINSCEEVEPICNIQN